jgi:hypothetical protein
MRSTLVQSSLRRPSGSGGFHFEVCIKYKMYAPTCMNNVDSHWDSNYEGVLNSIPPALLVEYFLNPTNRQLRTLGRFIPLSCQFALRILIQIRKGPVQHDILEAFSTLCICFISCSSGIVMVFCFAIPLVLWSLCTQYRASIFARQRWDNRRFYLAPRSAMHLPARDKAERDNQAVERISYSSKIS